jgi:hypothetical protein
VYDRLDQNSPLFSPWSYTTGAGGTSATYTYQNSGCPCVDPCAAARPLAAPLPVFVCPSAPRVANPFKELTYCFGAGGGGACNPRGACWQFSRLSGASDYGGINGYHCSLLCWFEQNGGLDCHAHPRCGVLQCPSNTYEAGQYGGITIEQITDGTSTTLLAEEMAGKPDLWIRGVRTPMSTCTPSPIQKFTVTNPGGCWGCWSNDAHWIDGSTFNGLAHPASKAPTCFFNCTNENNINAVYSFHPGAGGVVMCDGSAHMLSENISVAVFVKMISYNGRQAVLDSQF